MNLKPWQIISIFILIFFYFNNGPIAPTPYKPDLKDEELESKAIAGMLVLYSEPKPNYTNNNYDEDKKNVGQQQDIKIELKDVKPETINNPSDYVWGGRVNRTILLTDTKHCLPCIKADNEIVKVLDRNSVWTVGKGENNALQVIDLSKDPELFWNTVEILKTIGKSVKTTDKKAITKLINYSPMTPTFINLDEFGKIKDIQVGLTTMKQFSDFLEKNKME